MLAAEDKRWLVVGICLSKVLTPVIRTVVEHEMQQLCQALIVPPHNIHSQTFACHVTCVSPSTLTLNYANINDNTNRGTHANYDYSVKDDVSLAKLFVKPFMASFTGFDGSLDLSAALSILCGAPNFVLKGVDTIAKDVRSKVRNEWGHCKSSTWTEAYYLDCFLSMEKLIRILNFPATLDQANVLEELETWRKTGIDICFGHPINNDILKFVQEELTTLSKSVEENKESWIQDHEGLRNHLQNLTNLFGLDIKRLEDKQVTLERGFVRLESRTESLEEKLDGMSQAEDKHISTHNISFASVGFLLKIILLIAGLCLVFLLHGNFSELKGFVLTYWHTFSEGGPILTGSLIVLVSSLLFFRYEHHSKGSMLRYWYARRGSMKGGRTLTFVYTTYNHQTPTVNGIEFSWEDLKRKLDLKFDRLDEPGIHYYLNIDRYAYGGLIHVRSVLDNLPQVLGAEVVAVNPECTKIFFEEAGIWKPYRSARKIHCIPANRWF